MDNSEKVPWVQVIGRIAVHRPGRTAHEPTRASRVLLCILVAAGPRGASLEDIAEIYWDGRRPTSWMSALRASARILSTQLPEGWNVDVIDEHVRIVPGDGFIDVWEVERLLAGAEEHESTMDWLRVGRPFADIMGIPRVDAAARRLKPLIHTLAATATTPRAQLSSRSVFAGTDAERLEWLRGVRRAIVVATPANHQLMAESARSDVDTQTHIIVGDRRLQLPFGPFSVAFPALRDESHGTSHDSAFRAITAALATQAIECPQRLLVANAPELDSWSIKLASLLIERGRQSDFSLIFCADLDDREPQWLDFVDRSVTAGCELIDLTTE